MAYVPVSLGGDGGHGLDQITVNSADVRKNKVYVNTDRNAQNGIIPDIAGRTITSEVSQQTVGGGGYLTGNIAIPGFSLPAASIIKKGVTVTIYGWKVIGTLQDWVGDAGDLYINGQNNAGFTIYGSTSQQGRIALGSGFTLTSAKSYTLT